MIEVVRGQSVRCRISARLPGGGVPTADPTTVVIRITDPLAASTDYTLAAAQVVRDTTTNAFGDYYYDLSTSSALDTQLGYWIVAGITTGNPEVAEKNVFRLVSEKVR